ncbi:MAG: DnaJ domain-containing protein [Kangiellaceae bacterium]|nr:DnaJ domain-containing protein [Kangiellaceae bacterium]MCW9000689.1 DnaJ domain-containing protein [Kangiellaceae bacterium]
MDEDILLDFINAKDGVTQEYPLLRHLEDNHPDFFKPLGHSPSLFKKHFYLFHKLYLLNQRLVQNKLRLTISPLEIRLCSIGKEGDAIGETDALMEFYLNQDNLNLSEEAVADMQKKFWEKYLALDKKAEAIKVLGLEGEESLDRFKLKKRFNELAQKTHPDKGGDEKQFVLLKQAYESLKQIV